MTKYRIASQQHATFGVIRQGFSETSDNSHHRLTDHIEDVLDMVQINTNN
jgi:hypothetical protein